MRCYFSESTPRLYAETLGFLRKGFISAHYVIRNVVLSKSKTKIKARRTETCQEPRLPKRVFRTALRSRPCLGDNISVSLRLKILETQSSFSTLASLLQCLSKIQKIPAINKQLSKLVFNLLQSVPDRLRNGVIRGTRVRYYAVGNCGANPYNSSGQNSETCGQQCAKLHLKSSCDYEIFVDVRTTAGFNTSLQLQPILIARNQLSKYHKKYFRLSPV